MGLAEKVIYCKDLDGNITVCLQNSRGERLKVYPLSNNPVDLLHWAIRLAEGLEIEFRKEKAVVMVVEDKGV